MQNNFQPSSLGNRLPLALLLTLAIGQAACTRTTTPAETEPEAHTDSKEDSPTNRIDIPPGVRKNLGIEFAQVEKRRITQTLRIPGAFEFEPLARKQYRMALPGHVELKVDHLQAVESGTVLYRFRSPQWPELLHEIIEGEQAQATADAARRVAQARLVETQEQLGLLHTRLQTLEEARFKRADLEAEAAALRATLPRLEAEVESTNTQLENASRTHEHALHRAAAASGLEEGHLIEFVEWHGKQVHRYETIEWIDVRASAPGVVEALHATDGAFIESPGEVLTLVDPSRVRFRGLALQADLTQIIESSAAFILPPKGNGLVGEAPVPAMLTMGLDAHPQERTQVLYAKPQTVPRWVRPGLAAFLEVELRSTEAAVLAIPRASLIQDGLRFVYFMRDPKDANQAIRVDADLGLSDDDWVEIASGLTTQDQVVLDGAFELKLASDRSGGMPKGGHFHSDGSFHAEDE